MKSIAHFAFITALFSAFTLLSASATERYFTYTYEPETPGALRFGFRSGFRGPLHMKSIRGRPVRLCLTQDGNA